MRIIQEFRQTEDKSQVLETCHFINSNLYLEHSRIRHNILDKLIDNPREDSILASTDVIKSEGNYELLFVLCWKRLIEGEKFHFTTSRHSVCPHLLPQRFASLVQVD